MQTAKNTYDLAGLGELLMDMTPVQTAAGKGFVANPGGAPCNFLAMASRMGVATQFFGKVGNDEFGKALAGAATQAGVGIEGLILDPGVPTTLAFVHLDHEGDRSFSFYRKGCADVSYHLSEVAMPLFRAAKALYFGSLALTDEPLKTTAKALIAQAKDDGKLLFCDPNYRPALWASQDLAIEAMVYCIRQAHVVKLSDEEIRLITGIEDLWTAGEAVLKLGPKLVLITSGASGSRALTMKERVEVPALLVDCLDTTGAGDAFFGTIAAALLAEDTTCPDTLEKLSQEALIHLLRLGNTAAGLCVTQYGAIPALPEGQTVIKRAREVFA